MFATKCSQPELNYHASFVAKDFRRVARPNIVIKVESLHQLLLQGQKLQPRSQSSPAWLLWPAFKPPCLAAPASSTNLVDPACLQVTLTACTSSSPIWLTRPAFRPTCLADPTSHLQAKLPADPLASTTAPGRPREPPLAALPESCSGQYDRAWLTLQAFLSWVA